MSSFFFVGEVIYMTTEYIAKIKGDTSSLENALKKAQGHLERLNDNEIILKLNYDSNEQELNSIIKKIIDKNPEITVDIQYQLNKAALEHEIAKLSDMEMTADTSKLTNKLQELHKQYTQIFTSASNEELDAIEHEMAQLYSTILNCANGFEALEKLPKDLQEQLEDLEDVEPLKVFSESEIKKQRTIVQKFQDKIKELSSQLKSVDDQTKNNNGFSNIAKEANDTKSSLEELVKQFGEYSKAHDYNKVSSFWEEYRRSIEEGNQEAKELLKTLNLIDDKTGDIKLVNSGMVKSGGIIGDNSVLLATKNRELSNGSDRLTETIKLKDKLNEAADAGINVARILDIVADSEKKVFLELQEKAFGKNIGDYENSWVNPEIYEATDAQIQKLIQDFKLLNELGIGVDANVSNILYNKEKGFSFIDLDLNPAQYKDDADALDDLLGGITGTIRDFYEELGDLSGVAKIDSFENRIHDIVQSTSQGVSAVKESVKSIQQTDLDNGQVVDVAELEKAQGRIEELQDSVDSLSTSLVNSVSSWQYDAVRDTLFDAEDQIDHLNSKLKEQQEIMSNVQKFYFSYGTPTEALDANYFANISEVLDVLGGKFKELDQEAEGFCEQKVNALFLQDLVSQLDLTEDQLTVIKAKFSDVFSLLPDGKFFHLSDAFTNASQVEKELREIRDIAEGIHIVTDEDIESARNILNIVKEASNKTPVSSVDITEKETTALQEQTSAVEKNTEAKRENNQVEQSQELDNIQRLNQPLLEVIDLIERKTQAFREEDVAVDSVISNEIGNLFRLSSTLEGISGQIKSMGSIPVSLDVDSSQFVKVTEDIGSAIKNLKIKDTGFLSSIQEILSKGKELENLVKILTSSKKQIDTAKTAAVSKKDKESKASYEKELSLLKEQLKLQHEIEMAKITGSDKAKEVEAKNTPIIEMLKKQIDLEKQRAKNGIKTSQQYRDMINAEKKAIQERYDAEEKGAKKVAQVRSEQKTQAETEAYVNSYIKQLESLQNKISKTIDLKGDDLVSDYVDQLEIKVNQLKEVIDKINSNQLDITNEEDKAELDDLINQAEKLKNNLEKAAKSVSISKVDNDISQYLAKNTKLSKEFRDQLIELRNRLKDDLPSDGLADIVTEFNRIKIAARDANQEGRGFFDSVKNRLDDMNAKFLAQYFSWQDWIRYAREAFEVVKQYDTALTEMMKVSDDSRESLVAYQKESFNVASTVGSTALELQNATADWMRLGESATDAAKSAHDATVLLNVSEFQNIEDATQALVSASQAYKELDKMNIVDVLNNIGNNFSVSTDQLAQGLQNAAAVLKTQGNDLNEAVALLTAGNAITQDMSKTSAGIRTIALRIAGTEEAKDELIQLGEDVDDMIVGTHAKMQGLIKDYTAVASNAYEGIDILDANGNLRNTYDILLDISEIYQEILDEDKRAGANRGQALIEAIAGKNRSNIAASILLNPQMLKDVYSSAQDSAGSAQKELDKYLDSLEGHVKEFQNATQELIFTLIDSGILKDLIDFGTDFIQILTEIVDKLGTPGVLGVLISILGILKGGQVKSAIEMFSKLGDFSKFISGASKAAPAMTQVTETILEGGSAGLEMAQSMGTAGAAMGEATGAAGGLSGIISGLASTLGISTAALGAFAAAAVLIAGAVIAWDTFTVTVKEAQQAIQESESKVSELQSEIDELNAIELRTDGQQQRLKYLESALELQNQILESARETYLLEKYGNKFSDQFDSDNAYTQYQNDMAGRALEFNGEEYVDVNKESIAGSIALLDEYRKRVADAKAEDNKRAKALEGVKQVEASLRDEEKKYSDEVLDYNQKILDAKEAIASGVFSPDSSQYANAVEMIQSYSRWVQEDLAVIRDVQKALGTYDDFTEEKLRGIASNVSYGGDTENTYRNLINLTKDFSNEEKAVWFDAVKNANSYSEAVRLGEEALAKLNHTQDDVADGAESLVDTWNKSEALAKFDIDEAAFDKYLETFRELNPELEATPELLEQIAVANMAFDQSVEDLRSHLNDYVENLETLDSSSVEYANSVKALAQDLSGLTGIDFSITDAQNFAADQANLELLRQALDGDNDALNRLRMNAASPIMIDIFANAGLDTTNFDLEFNSFIDWLNNTDLGTLEAQTYLNESPFIEKLKAVIIQGGEAAATLKKLFASLGWDITWDTKPMKVPSLNSNGKSFTQIPTSELNKMSASQKAKYLNASGGWRYDMIDVPTNIRFTPKGSGTTTTAPRISKPTSSSGSNYKPSQKSGGSGGGGGGSSSPSSSKDKTEDPTEEAKKDEEELEDTYDEFFDYFERRLKVISDAISLLDANLENVVGSKTKNTLLDAQMRIYKMQQDEYAGAQDMYQEMADRALAKIDDSDIVEKIKNGAVAIDEFIGKGNEEVVEAINDYTKWADKVADCKQQLAELREEIRQLELTKMKNILQDWQDVFDLRQSNAIDLIDKQIDLIEETGNLVGRAFYEQQRSQTEGQLRAMEQARRELSDELNRGLSNGTIEIGSDEWLEEVGLLQEVEGQILDCKKAIEEYDNSILNIHTEVFERIQDQFDNLDSEISDLVSLLEDVEPGDDFGNWTKEGIAQAGLLAQQYELANKQTKSLSEEIAYLNSQYNSGKYSTTEYTERLADLTSQQRSSAKAAEDAKKSLISLNKARIDIEITAIQKDVEEYKKLIDAQKKSLQASKDLHDYEKNIAGQNRNISDIERRLAAMSGDNTASAIAKRKALEKELSDARMELEETEYDHSITSQQDALDQQAEQYETARQAEIDKLNEYLENETQVLSDTFEAVKARALEIGQTIAQTAQEHGIQVSESLTAAWKAGSDAIASYGEVLTPATSEFIAQLEDVEEHTWELQEQADVTSVQLAAMFANRADNLVDELQHSWDSEANLNEMTKALEDSFVHTIDTAGHIGEIVASNMAEAEAATDAVKDAAESAADAFNDMADSASAAGSAARSAISDLNALEAKANDSSWKSGTAYEPPYKTHYTSVYNAPYSGVQWDSIGGHYKKKAKGLRKADQNELMWTQELGDEVIVSPTRNSILTPIKKNDSILTASMTKNLWELAKVDPKQLLEGNGANISAPQIQSNNSSVQIGTLVNVEGSISDDNLTDVKQTIQEELKKTFRNINSGLLR